MGVLAVVAVRVRLAVVHRMGVAGPRMASIAAWAYALAIVRGRRTDSNGPERSCERSRQDRGPLDHLVLLPRLKGDALPVRWFHPRTPSETCQDAHTCLSLAQAVVHRIVAQEALAALQAGRVAAGQDEERDA